VLKPSVGAWEGRPMLISAAGAWALIDGAWRSIDYADAAWSGRVMSEAAFSPSFPACPRGQISS
jgi:hypothetical protein